jgi:hypothetical protein
MLELVCVTTNATQGERYRTWQQGKRGARPAKSWVEFELDDERWTVTLGFVNHGDELVLADVRIFPTRSTPDERGVNPNERKREWGDWSWDPELVPRGGLALRTIRALSIGGALRAALANVPPSDSYLRDAGFVAANRPARMVSRKPPELDARRRAPVLLARVAVWYERALAAGESPNGAIYGKLEGTKWQVARGSVPGLVRAARAAGYLTAAVKGRASGRATAIAHALVSD